MLPANSRRRGSRVAYRSKTERRSAPGGKSAWSAGPPTSSLSIPKNSTRTCIGGIVTFSLTDGCGQAGVAGGYRQKKGARRKPGPHRGGTRSELEEKLR